ncbi:hypothetical protein BH24GEM3_BH24GEM3_04480 [soil metagenome]
MSPDGSMATTTTSNDFFPELLDCRRQHEEIRQRVEALLEGMTLEQFNYSPAPGRWTVAQNIEHLSLEGEEQVEIIQGMINQGTARHIHGEGPFRYRGRVRWANWYLRFLEPPYRTKIPTLDRYTAPPQLTFEAVVPRFMHIKQRFLEQIEQANGLDLARLTAPLPYLKGWNPSLALGQWFLYAAVHERRHLWQIQNFVLNSPGYPR